MPRFKLRRPTLAEALLGLWMGAVVVFGPLVGTYLRGHALDPEINWVLLTLIWIAGSATFAFSAQFLFKPPPQ